MNTYLVTFKPMEPYFFGNEKTFLFPGSENDSTLANQYFIKSEYTPSQSTILGALRYLFLPVKLSDWNYSTEQIKQNADAVGSVGFNPSEDREFGKIKKISPVFLHDGEGILVPTPFDHISGKSQYTPFSQYRSAVTPEGERYYTDEYASKEGITCDYMKLSGGDIVPFYELFKTMTRTGINRSKDTQGYFKKEYAMLDEKYAFGVYLTLDDGLIPHDDVIFLGQGKSAFSVCFTPEDNHIAENMKQYLRSGTVYCLGDAFIDPDVYEKSLFAVTKTKTYRAYRKNGAMVTKDSELYRLITAGSIFIPRNAEEFSAFIQNNNVNRIGFNEFITKE